MADILDELSKCVTAQEISHRENNTLESFTVWFGFTLYVIKQTQSLKGLLIGVLG